MGLSKYLSAGAAALLMTVGPAMADRHGNDFVHSRAFNGQVYVMYETHMSLYTYANDTTGVSTCYGACARDWPPALLAAGTSLGESYSLIERSDGTMQAAFRGNPLYLSKLDKKIGDTNGDGVGNIWFLARP